MEDTLWAAAGGQVFVISTETHAVEVSPFGWLLGVGQACRAGVLVRPGCRAEPGGVWRCRRSVADRAMAERAVGVLSGGAVAAVAAGTMWPGLPGSPAVRGSCCEDTCATCPVCP